MTGTGVYNYPDIVQLSVYADEGYRFVKWSDENLNNPRAFVVEGDLDVEAICEEIPEVGVDDVEDDDLLFYVVGRTIYNPSGEVLRVYSTSGKLLKQGDTDIDLSGYSAGMYFVANARGNTRKVMIK